MEQDNTPEAAAVQAATQAEPAITPLEFITTSTGNEMTLAGPLAQAYSQGLDELYGNDKEPSQALESEAVDLGLIRRDYIASKRPLLDPVNKAALGLCYGVQKGKIEVKNVIDIVERLAQMSDRQRPRSAVIVDTYIRAVPGKMFQKEQCVALEEHEVAHNRDMYVALEQVCAVRGVPIYSSFEEFLEKHV